MAKANLSVIETMKNAGAVDDVAVVSTTANPAPFVAAKFVRGEELEEVNTAITRERESIYPWNDLKAPVTNDAGRILCDYFFVPAGTKKKLDQNVNQRNNAMKGKGRVERFKAIRATGKDGVDGVKVYRIA